MPYVLFHRGTNKGCRTGECVEIFQVPDVRASPTAECVYKADTRVRHYGHCCTTTATFDLATSRREDWSVVEEKSRLLVDQLRHLIQRLSALN